MAGRVQRGAALGETPESVRRELRASRLYERGSEVGVWHLPQQVICEDQLSERGVFSVREQQEYIERKVLQKETSLPEGHSVSEIKEDKKQYD